MSGELLILLVAVVLGGLSTLPSVSHAEARAFVSIAGTGGTPARFACRDETEAALARQG